MKQLRSALIFQVFSSTLVCRSPGSTSALRALDSSSTCRPIVFTLAPHSLCSTVVHHPLGPAGLPYHSDSTFFSYHPGCATDVQSSTYASSLHPFGSNGLFLPSSSTVYLAPSFSTSVPQACCSTSALQSIVLPWVFISLATGLHHTRLHLSRSGSWLGPRSSLLRFCHGPASRCFFWGSLPGCYHHHPLPGFFFFLGCPFCHLRILLLSPLPPSCWTLGNVTLCLSFCWTLVGFS